MEVSIKNDSLNVSIKNDSLDVSVINNPLKQIKFSATYKAENGHNLSSFDEVQKSWTVDVIPHYMDLKTGVWNVALDSYVYRLKTPATIDTIFEISTSLVTSYEVVSVRNRYRPFYTRLGVIHAVAPAAYTNFGPFDQKWFTVEKADSSFQLFISQHPMSIWTVPKVEVEFEILFLFQRIR
jgi:hypothetical protein